MVKSREDLVKWAIDRAEQYLKSARDNLTEGRLYPAAEDIFRAMETSLEALLYYNGINKIEYPGRKKKFTPLEIKELSMFYTYVIQSKKDSKWYTGSTNNLWRRLKEHNDNKIFSTKGRGHFELIYYEACINEQDARVRERYLKSGMGKRYLRTRLKRFLSLAKSDRV